MRVVDVKILNKYIYFSRFRVSIVGLAPRYGLGGQKFETR